MTQDETVWAGNPIACYCDNGHEQNDTVCMYCWNNGRRHWNDPDPKEAA